MDVPAVRYGVRKLGCLNDENVYEISITTIIRDKNRGGWYRVERLDGSVYNELGLRGFSTPEEAVRMYLYFVLTDPRLPWREKDRAFEGLLKLYRHTLGV